MIEKSGEAIPSFSSSVAATRTLPRRIGDWFDEPSWHGRGVLVCVAELALVALSFLSASSFVANAGYAYMPTATTLIFLPLALVLRGIAFQYFGVCDRSFRHAGIADAIAIGEAVGTSSVMLYFISFFVKAHTGIFLPGRLFIGDAITLFLLLCAFHFGARIYN